MNTLNIKVTLLSGFCVLVGPKLGILCSKEACIISMIYIHWCYWVDSLYDFVAMPIWY